MSFSGESSDSECPLNNNSSDSRKATKVKTEQILKSEKKYYQQRFVEGWLDRFKPWLARDAIDPNKPFCRACNCRLNCNKCHLQRHEKTTKHNSNLEAYMSANGMVSFKQNVGQKKERRKVIKTSPQTEADDDSKFESVFMDIDFEAGKREKEDEKLPQETLHDFQFIQNENEGEIQQMAPDDTMPHLYETNIVHSTAQKEKPTSTRRSDDSSSGKKDRKKLLLQIQKDKNELMSSFNELFSNVSVEKKERNHVDLFFDSVSSSVKALTPKLIAEAKMRVSQLVCELELRAITENETINASAGPSSTVLLAVPPGNAYIINQNQVGSSQNDHAYEPTG
ncbi:protein suppressor of variegation 3-7-like isoform X2 [Eupeodes corollae]|uniref:protein suppressor of variegation 3-7-like isoform X2 n=1 Tax=Eupeodes corollae TaxID=290404 RepID=UPI002491B5A8|nr:protein suppressor of variegation 3-7-like isoform X2 [Eupeodes corollae]